MNDCIREKTDEKNMNRKLLCGTSLLLQADQDDKMHEINFVLCHE